MGFRSLMDPVMIGEFARSYHPDELPVTNSMLFVAELPSALIAFLTTNIKFYIGGLYITYGNSIGIEMIVLVKILVTRETDDVLQESNDETDLETKEEFKPADNYLLLTDACHVNERVSKNYDVWLMYFLVFLFHYVTYLTFVYLPLLIQAELKYSTQLYNIICLVLHFYYHVFIHYHACKGSVKNGLLYWLTMFYINSWCWSLFEFDIA